jgi:hypothetical protein
MYAAYREEGKLLLQGQLAVAAVAHPQQHADELPLVLLCAGKRDESAGRRGGSAGEKGRKRREEEKSAKGRDGREGEGGSAVIMMSAIRNDRSLCAEWLE